MELILIRHLKTPGNEKRQYIGSTDEALSEQEVQNFVTSDRQSDEEMHPNGGVDLSEEPGYAGRVVKGM